MPRKVKRSMETISQRIQRLKRYKCLKGHLKKDAIIEIDHRTGGVRLRCRTCHKERLRRYYQEGRTYRY